MFDAYGRSGDVHLLSSTQPAAVDERCAMNEYELRRTVVSASKMNAVFWQQSPWKTSEKSTETESIVRSRCDFSGVTEALPVRTGLR
jgi:hypothetical protein